MAMDDTYDLVRGVLIDGVIAIPEKWVDMAPAGKWTVARVLDACITVTAIGDGSGYGRYSGYVRYHIGDGNLLSDGAHQDTFFNLLMNGWVSRSFMEAAEDAKRQQAKEDLGNRAARARLQERARTERKERAARARKRRAKKTRKGE